MAGKKARVLYRLPDGSVVLQVEDPHDEVLVTVEPDGSMYEHRIVGFGAGVREAWDEGAVDVRVAAAFAPVPVESVPVRSRGVPAEFAGSGGSEKESAVEKQPVKKPVSEPVSVPEYVAQAAKDLAVAVHSRAVGVTCGDLYQGKNAGDVDQYLAHAAAMNWVIVEDGLVRRGAVDPRPVTTLENVDGPSWGGRMARMFRG